MINTQYITLNMVTSGVLPVLYCSQYDIGRPLGVVVYDSSAPVDMDTYTVTIEATRTDGTAITAAVTTDGNVGTFDSTATMTNVADQYDAQLVLVDGNSNRVASLPFVMCVVPAAMDENAESISEDASLYQQYNTTVQAQISTEASTRQTADTSLQNAITAETTARTYADSTLQTNINAEASTRASADNTLQAQIDQLVAPSGSAPSAAEVENARISADGVTYDTLGNAIRGQVGDLKSALTDAGISCVAFIPDGYISDNVDVGETVDVTPGSQTAALYALVACNQGDVVYLTGTGFGGARLWAFVDSNYKLLEKSASSITRTDYILTAPANSAYLILNVSKAKPYSALIIKKTGVLLRELVNSSHIVINHSNASSYGITNADSLPTNSIVGFSDNVLSTDVANLPAYGSSCSVLTYSVISGTDSAPNGTVTVQMFVPTNASAFYYRAKAGGSYSAWKRIPVLEEVVRSTGTVVNHSNASTLGYTDANMLPTNSVIGFASNVLATDVTNLPEYVESASVLTYSVKDSTEGTQNGTVTVQLYIRTDGLAVYCRSKASASYSAWYKLESRLGLNNLDEYFVHTCVQKPIRLDSTQRVILFGDSLTIRTGSDEGTNTWWLQYVSEETGCAWTTYGRGSSAFVDTGNEQQVGRTIIRQIKSQWIHEEGDQEVVDWNCNLVVVAAGTNDAGFGYNMTGVTNTEYLGLLKTAVEECIDEIKELAPADAKIIFITPIRRRDTGANGVLIDDFLPKVASVIANTALINGCSVINGFDFPIPVTTTDCYTRMTNYDGLHPNNVGKQVYARAFLDAVSPLQ